MKTTKFERNLQKIILYLFLVFFLISCSTSSKTIKPCKSNKKYFYKRVVDLNERSRRIIKHKYCVLKTEYIDSLSDNQGVFCGIIVDRKSNEKLQAAVSINNENRGVMANTEGYFEIKLSSGVYDFYIRYIGNDILIIKNFEIKPKTKTKINVYLGTSIIE